MQKLSIMGLLLCAVPLFCAGNQQALQPHMQVCLSNDQFNELLKEAKAGNSSGELIKLLLEREKDTSWGPSAGTATKTLATGVGVIVTGLGINRYKKELGVLMLVSFLHSLLPAIGSGVQADRTVASQGIGMLGSLLGGLRGNSASSSGPSMNMAQASGPSAVDMNRVMDIAKQIVLATMQGLKAKSGPPVWPHGNAAIVAKL